MDNKDTIFMTNKLPTFDTKDFLESNSLVAKIAYLLLILFAFVVLLRLGISFLSWFFNRSTSSSHLINGMVSAKQQLIFQQDPAINNSVTIQRSENENTGIEFTWSVWIFIDDLQYNQGQYRHIFSKGNSETQNGMAFPNNAPGLYISPERNDLIVVMNTFNVINEDIRIPDIPMNKWVNVIMRCENVNLDVYINGTIVRSVKLMGVPKQNFGNVFVGLNGGFSGYVSNLWYYNYALGTTEIQHLSLRGPNTKMSGPSAMGIRNPDYLSLRWYFYGAEDAYNPGPNVKPEAYNKV
jgi:hypothetical protein